MTVPELLHSLTETELSFIAGLDYGAEVERHMQGLRKVISRDGMVQMDTEVWFPYEVIELGKNILKQDHEREYTACLAIILLNIEAGNDEMNDPLHIKSLVNDHLPLLPSDLADLLLSLSEKIPNETQSA